MTQTFPDQAQAVIIGGGVIGTSVAYHLTLLGWTDIVVLERNTLSSGTTWHAAGLVGQLRATHNMTRLAQYTTELFAGLEAETGQATGFRQNGSLTVAPTRERFEELQRGASMARRFGLEVEVITPAEAQALYPIAHTGDLVGAVYLPKDGQCNPADVTQAYAKGARKRGAKIFEHTKVTGVQTKNARVWGVRTDRGDIKTDCVVNCAGLWGREVGHMAGGNVPLQAAEHFYIVTEPLAEVTPNLPVMRDPDGYTYYKEDAGKLLIGCFEPGAKPWDPDSIGEDQSFITLPEDWGHFEPVMENALKRVPVLEKAGIQLFFCGPESFTPDVRYSLGEAPEIKNFFVAAGFNSIGIQSSGGAGKVLSEWIVNGEPPMDLWDVDIRRWRPFQNNRRYLRERTTEALGLLYAMHWPFRQFETSRGVRKSALHDRLRAKGACFGESTGWERANWFAPEGVSPEYRYSYGRQNWFGYSGAEHRAVRNTVGLFDMSSFAKFLLQGPDAERVLNRVCANNVAVAPGKVVYTQWLNRHGGIEADLTCTRLGEDRYLIVTGAALQTRDFHWLKSHIAEDARVSLNDITSGYGVLSIMGPNARQLLQELTDAALDNESFPFGTAKEIELGFALVRALRITYMGELGWELYIPTEYMVDVYDRISAAGDALGLAHCGLHAMDSLRMEKGYRHFGHDITPDDTALEAGLQFAVALDKNADFIGRDALLRQQEKGPLTKRMVQLQLQDPGPLMYHKRYPVKASLKPLYDPHNQRIKA